MGELKFKVNDLVMYANKIGQGDGMVEYYYMKPAKVIGINPQGMFKYQTELLSNEDKSNWFQEEELLPIATTKQKLDTMMIRDEITEKEYEQLLKVIEEENNG